MHGSKRVGPDRRRPRVTASRRRSESRMRKVAREVAIRLSYGITAARFSLIASMNASTSSLCPLSPALLRTVFFPPRYSSIVVKLLSTAVLFAFDITMRSLGMLVSPFDA